MADQDDFRMMISKFETRLTLLERERDDAVPGPRVQLFVQQFVEPMRQSMVSIERTMERLADKLASQEERGEELYLAHKQFLDRAQEQKDAEAKERTPMGLVRKYLPVVSLIGGAIMIFRVLGTLIEAYVQGIKAN